jgi:dihydroorotate dehydrogenase (fumarate)
MYDIVADPGRSSLAIETDLRDLVREMKRALQIPVAMKLSPYFTAPANLARRLDEADVDGLVLFNRFYLPDIDITQMTMTPRIDLSTRAELPLRLHWIALLRGRVRASLALTGGVATPADGAKALLAGADAVQMVSAILRDGPGLFGRMRDWLATYMAGRGFERVSDLKGRVSFSATDDPASAERAAYLNTLQSWTTPEAESERAVS